MIPGAKDLWFLPLGGTGEIGMNLNLYGHAGHWVMVDCGVTFSRDGEPGPKVRTPDPEFIVRHRDALLGLLLTHAHEDHIGAVAHLWPELRCPVYCSAFAAAVLRRKLAERGLEGRVPVQIVAPDTHLDLGPFRIRWLSITHSIPEAHALLLATAAGTVFHTGDWKLDPEPVIGPAPDAAAFKRLGDAGIDVVVCDSTNALTPGHSLSEAAVHRDLRGLTEAAKGRVVVTTFGSNVARLHTLLRVARDTRRYAALLGRSLHNIVAAAREAGHWQPARELISAREAGYLPPEEVLLIATGSQGDPGAALDRLSRGTHPDLELEEGDTVLFSARAIPGNEQVIARLVDRLRKRGLTLKFSTDACIHASGHPCEDELAILYRWLRPGLVIPTHGTATHMQRNAEIAARAGVRRQLTGLNGDLFLLAPQPGVRRRRVGTGRLGVTDRGLVPIASTGSDSAVHGA